MVDPTDNTPGLKIFGHRSKTYRHTRWRNLRGERDIVRVGNDANVIGLLGLQDDIDIS